MKVITLYLILTLGILCVCSTGTFAQSKADVHNLQHKAIANDVWDTFDLLMYRVDKKNGKTVYTPHFPEKLARLDSKTVKLQGYMIPLRSAIRHNSFLFSVLPLHQCMFCGTNGIPAMVEVTLAGNEKEKIRERPITISGIVHLNVTDRTRTEILLDDCRLVNTPAQ